MSGKKNYSYSDAGVSIDRGNQLVERIKPLARSTNRPGVMGSIGGFGGLFDIGALDYRDPILVSGTDGVGTKLKLALDSGKNDTIGIDLVAMCVNDLLVTGAEPLFFLDYYVCEHLDVKVAERVISGIVRGCEIAGCALIGGETAEHPGTFSPNEYDLAGFCVGIVERDRIIDGSSISPGDVLIALASSGCHSNGYSLIRRLLQDTATSYDIELQGRSIIELLLEPTNIYAKAVLAALPKVTIKGMSHITGGGLVENIPRILPSDVMASIDCSSWQWPPIFQWLQDAGSIEPLEMYRTFNCGVGYVLIVGQDDAAEAIELFNNMTEQAWLMGRIEERLEDQSQIQLTGK